MQTERAKEVMKEYRFSELKKGQTAVIEAELTDRMLDTFSEISGDRSAIHTSGEFARESGFKGRIVHGLLLGSIVSRMVGMELPGKHGFLHNITLNFHKPCYVGYRIIVEAEITDIIESVKTIVVKVKIKRSPQEVLVTGKAQIGVKG